MLVFIAESIVLYVKISVFFVFTYQGYKKSKIEKIMFTRKILPKNLKMPKTNKEIARYNKLIGQKILFRRKELGLTLAQLSKKINVSTQQISKYQTGVNIRVGRLVQIAKVLMVEPKYFFEGLEGIFLSSND